MCILRLKQTWFFALLGLFPLFLISSENSYAGLSESDPKVELSATITGQEGFNEFVKYLDSISANKGDAARFNTYQYIDPESNEKVIALIDSAEADSRINIVAKNYEIALLKTIRWIKELGPVNIVPGGCMPAPALRYSGSKIFSWISKSIVGCDLTWVIDAKLNSEIEDKNAARGESFGKMDSSAKACASANESPVTASVMNQCSDFGNYFSTGVISLPATFWETYLDLNHDPQKATDNFMYGLTSIAENGFGVREGYLWGKIKVGLLIQPPDSSQDGPVWDGKYFRPGKALANVAIILLTREAFKGMVGKSVQSEAVQGIRSLADLKNIPVVEDGGGWGAPSEPWMRTGNSSGGGLRVSPGGGGGAAVATSPSRVNAYSPNTQPGTVVSNGAVANGVTLIVAGLPSTEMGLKKAGQNPQSVVWSPQFDEDGELGEKIKYEPSPVADADGGNNQIKNRKASAAQPLEPSRNNKMRMSEEKDRPQNGNDVPASPKGDRNQNGNQSRGGKNEESKNSELAYKDLEVKYFQLSRGLSDLLDNSKINLEELAKKIREFIDIETQFEKLAGAEGSGHLKDARLARAENILLIAEERFNRFAKFRGLNDLQSLNERNALESQILELVRFALWNLGIAVEQESFLEVGGRGMNMQGLRILPVIGHSHLNDEALRIHDKYTVKGYDSGQKIYRDYHAALAFIPAYPTQSMAYKFEFANGPFGIALGISYLRKHMRNDFVMVHEESHLARIVKENKGEIGPLSIKAASGIGDENRYHSILSPQFEGLRVRAYQHNQGFDEISAYADELSFIGKAISKIESAQSGNEVKFELPSLRFEFVGAAEIGHRVSAQTMELINRVEQSAMNNQLDRFYFQTDEARWGEHFIFFNVNDGQPFQIAFRLTSEEGVVLNPALKPTSDLEAVEIGDSDATRPVFDLISQRLRTARELAEEMRNRFEEVENAAKAGDWDLAIDLAKKLPKGYQQFEESSGSGPIIP
jgi:hypothetical protein